jgi:hypothetical protein
VTKDADLWGQALCGLAFDFGRFEDAASRAIARAAALESEVADLHASLNWQGQHVEALRAGRVSEIADHKEDVEQYEAEVQSLLADRDDLKAKLEASERGAAALRDRLERIARHVHEPDDGEDYGCCGTSQNRAKGGLESTNAGKCYLSPEQVQAERKRARELCAKAMNQERYWDEVDGAWLAKVVNFIRALDLTPPAAPTKAERREEIFRECGGNEPIPGPSMLASEQPAPSEPRTNEHCAKCGQSPEAARHQLEQCWYERPGPPYIEAWLAGGCMVCGSTERGPGFYTCLGCCSLAHRLEGWNAWVNACIQAKRERESGGGR